MRFVDVDIPEDLRYTRNHLWVKIRDGICTLGWTDYIQQNAGDVNYIELPHKNAAVEIGKEFGTIETSKWVDRLYSPITGGVADVNDDVVRKPELINQAPFTEGWFIKVKLRSEPGSQDSMSPMEYLEYIKTCEEGSHGIT
ncbi:MAG: glycine cleavage system protein GcvH [Pseudomonadota bacterium]